MSQTEEGTSFITQHQDPTKTVAWLWRPAANPDILEYWVLSDDYVWPGEFNTPQDLDFHWVAKPDGSAGPFHHTSVDCFIKWIVDNYSVTKDDLRTFEHAVEEIFPDPDNC